MIAAILLVASQVFAAAEPADGAQARVGVRVTALATAEILPFATTRDLPQDKPLQRRRRTSADGRITIEFE